MLYTIFDRKKMNRCYKGILVVSSLFISALLTANRRLWFFSRTMFLVEVILFCLVIFVVFPDECQSLEEIPAEEYAPEHTTPKAAGRGHLRHQTVNRLMDDSGNDEIAAHSLTNNAPDAATTSQTEEFNLRQAIIYSEILKPKFEE